MKGSIRQRRANSWELTVDLGHGPLCFRQAVYRRGMHRPLLEKGPSCAWGEGCW